MEKSELGYTGIREKWRPYRDLTADEILTMEEMRKTILFLNADPALHAHDPSASQK
jgi:hypothetical protein